MEKGGCVSLPDSDELIADLSAIRYEFTQDGRIKLEGKDDVRKRLGRSPDRADALVLSMGHVARPVAVICSPGLVGVGPSYWAMGSDSGPRHVPGDGRLITSFPSAADYERERRDR